MDTCLCVLRHFMARRVRMRGSGLQQGCLGSQISCHSVCSEGHSSQLKKDHCAIGPSVAFTPDRVLSGTAAGSQHMGVSQAAGQWPRGQSKMRRETVCLSACQVHYASHPEITGEASKRACEFPNERARAQSRRD